MRHAYLVTFPRIHSQEIYSNTIYFTNILYKIKVVRLFCCPGTNKFKFIQFGQFDTFSGLMTIASCNTREFIITFFIIVSYTHAPCFIFGT